jgi:hypothetical protein
MHMREPLLRVKTPYPGNTKYNSARSRSGVSHPDMNVWTYPANLCIAALICVVPACTLYFIDPTPHLEWLNFHAGGWLQALVLVLAFIILWGIVFCISIIPGKKTSRSKAAIAPPRSHITYKPLIWYTGFSIAFMVMLVGIDLMYTHRFNIVPFMFGLVFVLIWRWPQSRPVRWSRTWLDKRRQQHTATSIACLPGYFSSQQSEHNQHTRAVTKYDAQRNEDAKQH